ncbi:MAG: ATP-binding protein [Eubacteriaceae bacterium]
MAPSISRRESGALINSLTAGVVPRIGLRHIAVGRQNEVNAFLNDMNTIEDGGASFRLISGQYGSGKSFLLQMIRNNAMEKNFVVADADLSPERRLTGSKGQGLSTYRELLQHLSTPTRPDGGSLEAILQKWIMGLQSAVSKENGFKPGEPQLVGAVSERIAEMMMELSELSYGFAFANVLDAYWRGMKTDDDALKQNALRWLRGEYATKTEAKKELPVDRIIDDASWYEFLKLFAVFVKKAGYKGLLVFLDEGVNLYKIPHKQARDSNYEKLLTIFNDTMQGKAQNIGVFLSGTPQFIYDERRGLFNYDALRTRLEDNRFSSQNFVDFTTPVIKLKQLSPEEIFILLERLCELHSSHYDYDCTLGKDQLTAFLNTVLSRLGADQLLTPREITRDFLGLLNILQQNSNITFATLMDEQNYSVKSADEDPETISSDNDDLFAEFDI